MKQFIFLLIISTILIYPAKAQNAGDSEPDTLKTYRLGEVVATDFKERGTILPSVINKVTYHEIRTSDAASVSQLEAFIPSAFIQTNSRGQTLLFIRGAGERQLGLFFDGALANIPWDNRMDISLIPADIISSINVIKGAGSILYGPNVLGGAVNISTVERSQTGFGAIGRVQAGDGNSQFYSLTHDARIGHFNYIANVSYNTSAGDIVSGNAPADLTNVRENSSLLMNSDRERLSAYARGEYQMNGTTLGLSVNYIDASQGVTPEGNLGDDARFWRYPEIRRMMLTFNGEHAFDDDQNMRTTLWLDNYDQTINSYASADYNDIAVKQFDDNQTRGARIAYNNHFGDIQWLTAAFNWYNSTHSEKIESGDLVSMNDFEEYTLSAGAEYRIMVGKAILSAGFSYDMNETVKAGVFDEGRGLTSDGIGALAGIKYLASDNLTAFANLSRKTRFPTLREAYSAALNKFIVNPDLGPETGILSEIGAELTGSDYSVTLAGFFNYYDDMITRETVPGDSLKRYMRVNLSKGRIAGAELYFDWYALEGLRFGGHLTYIYSEGRTAGVWTRELEYKPEYLSMFTAEYQLPFRLKLRAEAEFTGSQYGENPNIGGMEKLDPTAQLNFRMAYNIPFLSGTSAEVFLRVNNITDEYILSKIGIPEPGRIIRGGLIFMI